MDKDTFLGELKGEGIQYTIAEHEAVFTAEAADAITASLAGINCKNLFLKDKKGSKFLLCIPTDRKVHMGQLSKRVPGASGSCRFLDEATLLDVLGVKQGSVTPFAVVNDELNTVTVVFDQKLTLNEGADLIKVHPLTNEATVAVAYKDVAKFITGRGNTVAVVDFDAELPAAPKKEKPVKQQKKGKQQQGKKKKEGGKGNNQDGMSVTREENFGMWYQQLLTKGQMIDYYDISGCYILRPWSYAIWEQIQDYFNGEIKKLGVKNSYFPLFVSKAALEAEKDHVEGFAAEVAWVTKSGQSELAEPIAIRPTSETVMYPLYAKWIRSHRDLPLKLNQWSNVVRWEFKHPTPFIRTREFLWQEGHSAFATLEEAEEETLTILNLYRNVYEELLAVPVVKGKKTEEEKFAGGRYTTTVEAFIPANGRGVQGATSHCLGDNFAKMFDIYYETKQGDRRHVIQNSWGLTTRTIGVMMMVHGDNDGLVLPPRVAPTQVMIVPVFYKDEAVCQQIREQCTAFEKALNAAGVRAESDLRTDKNPGFKYNQYELKGIPLRLEVGPGDVTKKQVMAKRRFGDQKKFAVDITDEKAAVARIAAELEAIQADMLAKATADRDARISQVTTWKEFNQELNKLHMVLAPWCGFKQCELKIKKDSAEAANLKVEAQGGPQGSATAGDADGDAEVFEQLTGAAKSLCTPFDQPALEEGTCCVRCDKKAINWTLFGRSY